MAADPTAGVVGDPAVLADTPVEAVAEDPAAAADHDLTVAVGDDALTDLVRAGARGPVLAVDAAAGVPSVAREAVADAVDAVLSGDVDGTTRRLLSVAVDGEPAPPVLRDAMLVTDEPARISEYAVHSDGRAVTAVRADGVVVATPAGSEGYLADAGGPVVQPGTGTVGVVAVAPFRTDRSHWVLDDAAVSVTVRRDQQVVLVADGREWGRVPAGAPVELAPGGTLALHAVGGDWKNSNVGRTE
jgi:NAD+ kinase